MQRKRIDYCVITSYSIHYTKLYDFTTHILTEAEYLCDEIAIINKGKILAIDTPDALKNKFGKEKTIKIHLLKKQQNIESLLAGIPDCKIDFQTGTNIIIHSSQSELVLKKILRILNENDITIDDLSAVPTNLEEIFLKRNNFVQHTLYEVIRLTNFRNDSKQ